MADRKLKEINEELYLNNSLVLSRSGKRKQEKLLKERIHFMQILDGVSPRIPIGQPASDDKNLHLKKENILRIEFEKEESFKLVFGMVKPGQMFLNCNGYLYQKKGQEDYMEDFNAWKIANQFGSPIGGGENFFEDEEIEKIYPKIITIVF